MILLQASELPGGYGVALLQTLLALAAVCILAWVVLRWAAQKGLGIGAGGKHVKVLERVALDARRTLWVVRIGEKVLLIGAGDGASPSTLAELAESDLARDSSDAKAPRFVDVLCRARPSGEADAKREAPRTVTARAEEGEAAPDHDA